MAHWFKSTYCSCRKPEFNSQPSHGGSELPTTPVPRNPMPSTELHRQQVCTLWTDIDYRQINHFYKMKKLIIITIIVNHFRSSLSGRYSPDHFINAN